MVHPNGGPVLQTALFLSKKPIRSWTSFRIFETSLFPNGLENENFVIIWPSLKHPKSRCNDDVNWRVEKGRFVTEKKEEKKLPLTWEDLLPTKIPCLLFMIGEDNFGKFIDNINHSPKWLKPISLFFMEWNPFLGHLHANKNLDGKSGLKDVVPFSRFLLSTGLSWLFSERWMF